MCDSSPLSSQRSVPAHHDSSEICDPEHMPSLAIGLVYPESMTSRTREDNWILGLLFRVTGNHGPDRRHLDTWCLVLCILSS